MAGKPRPDARERYAMIAEYWQTQEKPIAETVAPALGVSIHQVYKALKFHKMSPGKGTYRKIPYLDIERVYLLNRSQKATAKVLGLCDATVGRALDTLGYGTRRKGYQIVNPTPLDIVRARNENGENAEGIAKSFGVHKTVIYQRMKSAGIPLIKHGQATGEASPMYNGGEKTRTTKQRKEARSIGATALGRPLARGEVIHHHDCDPSNNAIENLWYFPTVSAHSSYHSKLKRRRNQGLEVDANQMGLSSGGVPLLELVSRSESSPDTSSPDLSQTQE